MKTHYIIFAGFALVSQAFFSAPASAQFYVQAQPSQFYLSTEQTASVYGAANAYSNTQNNSYNSCPQISLTLSRGMNDYRTGGQVSQLQQFLATRYGVPQLVVGTFGPMTQQYVKIFQQENGLSPVGIVGAQTRAAIQNACRTAYPTQPTYPTYPTYPQPTYPQPTYPSNPTQPAQSVPLCTISASPSSVQVGQQYVVSWSSQNATSAYLSGYGYVATAGSQTKQASNTGTVSYTLTVSSQSGGVRTCTGSVVVTDVINTTSFTANTTTGVAPLSVTFSNWSTGGLMIVGENPIIIDFGDGTHENAGDCYAPSDYCISPGTNMHTYAAGIYVARLQRQVISTNGTSPSFQTIATLQINVASR